MLGRLIVRYVTVKSTRLNDNHMSVISTNHKHDLLVISDDGRDDRISELFGSDVSLGSFDVRVCTLSNFLKERGFRLKRNPFGISMLVRDASVYNEDKLIVLSRVIGITDTTIDALSEGSARLQRGQVLWALNLALNGYKNKLSKSGLYSTVGSVLPLPTQYALIKKFQIPANVPKFSCLAFFEALPSEMQGRDLIVKSPFDFYHWKPGIYNGGVDKVVLTRPAGIPVVTYIMGDRCWNVSLGSAILPEGEVLDEMSGMARRVRQIFGGFMLEILWFVYDKSVTYACSSHLCRSLESFNSLNGFESELMRLCDEFSEVRSNVS